jgi:hypothetical protein
MPCRVFCGSQIKCTTSVRTESSITLADMFRTLPKQNHTQNVQDGVRLVPGLAARPSGLVRANTDSERWNQEIPAMVPRYVSSPQENNLGRCLLPEELFANYGIYLAKNTLFY